MENVLSREFIDKLQALDNDLKQLLKDNAPDDVGDLSGDDAKRAHKIINEKDDLLDAVDNAPYALNLDIVKNY